MWALRCRRTEHRFDGRGARALPRARRRRSRAARHRGRVASSTSSGCSCRSGAGGSRRNSRRGSSGGIERSEREWRHGVLCDPDEPCVDAKVVELSDRNLAERIGADLREHRGPVAKARGGDRDVRRAAADRLREARGRVPVGADLIAVQVDADPPDRQQLKLARPSSMRVALTSAASSLATPPRPRRRRRVPRARG